MKTFDALKGNEQAVLQAFNLPPVTGGQHYSGECPLCSGKKKFRLHYYQGALGYICVCGSGSLIELVMNVTGRQFSDVCSEIDKIIGNDFKNDIKPVAKCDFKQRFLSYVQLRDTDAHTYLINRGVYTLPKRGMRYCVGINDAQGYLPCIITVASDDYNKPCYEHRTFIVGGKKASVQITKRMFKINDGNNISVKLFDYSDVLGIAEGVETALSANQLYKIPTWSTLNSSFMKKFKAPAGVKTLYIFADNDKNGTGHAAAFACGNKNILSSNDVTRVVIRWSAERGDFNDVINNDSDVMEMVLEK